MTSKAKALGTAFERRVVEQARQKGIPATRQPLSGVLQAFPSDVVLNHHILTECKVRTLELDTKGVRFFRLDMDWLSTLAAHAEREGYEEIAVAFNAKGSKCPYVLLELDFFLRLLAEQVTKSQPKGG